MTLLPTSPSARILLAIALSVLIHMALLFAPMIELAPTEVPLPPLMAKLEPLPKIAPLPVPAKKKIHPKPATPKPAEPIVEKPIEPSMDKPVAPSPEPIAETPVEPPAAIKTEEPPPPAHPLPKQAQLTFAVYKSGTSFAIGEAHHRLNIDAEHRYTITTGANTTGIVRLLKKFELTQTSTGTLTENGLQPAKFVEDKLTSNGTETHRADFNWQEKTLYFSAGNSAALPNNSQDIVSFMYQLSQLQWGNNPIAMNISNGKKLEHYEIAVGEEELVSTPMGKLRAIPFRKIHGPNEEGLNIWLAVEYRLLPIKISQIERDGSTAGEMLISDIRVSDE